MAYYHIYSFGFYIYRIGEELYSTYIGLVKNLLEFILGRAVSCRASKRLGEDNTIVYTDKVSIGTKGKTCFGDFDSKTGTE